MQYRVLGSSGLRVSAIGLGGMPLSLKPDRPTEADAIAVIHHAIASGVTFIDTANCYCWNDTDFGHNERLIGKALRQLPTSVRATIVVATKGGLTRPEGRWEREGSPASLRKFCDASLLALGVDTIDLYQYHRIDPQTPLADSWAALAQLQQAGKVRHLGASNHSVADLEVARRIAPVVSLQNQYARNYRNPELDGTLDYTIQHGMAFLPWSPLDGMGGAKNIGSKHALIAQIALRMGVSVYQVALAWLLSRGPMVIPIPGASRSASIADSAKAADVQLSTADLTALNAEERILGNPF